MKSRVMSKISVVLLASMLLSMSLPVLAYAASYIKIVYDSSSGKISGIIYTDKSTVTLSTYSNNQWTDITSQTVGPIQEYLPPRSYDPVYYYLINGTLETGLSLDKIKVKEASWMTKVTEVISSVSDSVYSFENTAPDVGYGGFSYHFDDNNSTATIGIGWQAVQKPGVKGYRVYLDGNFIDQTRDTFFQLSDLPYQSKHQFAVSTVSSDGVESSLSYYSPMRVPSKLQTATVNINGKPNGYKLQHSDLILSFTSALNNPNDYPLNAKKTHLQLTLGDGNKVDFDGSEHRVPYQIQSSELDKSDFELVDEGGISIPIETFSYEYSHGAILKFTLSQVLQNDKVYTLRMSRSSSGTEISLPNINTNRGNLYLYIYDTIESPMNSFSMNNLVIGDGNPPAKPENLTFVEKDSQVDINWKANSEDDLQGYLVYLDGNLLTPTPITATQYSISGLTNGKKYHVNVAAVDYAGNRSLQAYAFPTPQGSTVDPGPGPGPGPVPGGAPVPPAKVEPGVKVIKPEDLKADNGKLPIKLAEGETQVKLPAGDGAITKDSVIELNSDKLTVEVPGSLLGQLQKLVSAEELKDAQISVSFDKLSNESAQEALKNTEGKLTNTTVKSAGDVYEFSLTIKTKDGKEQKLTVFDTPIKLKLKIADGADSKLLGVYYIGDNGQLEYVGGKIENGFMVADVSHFSKYAVLEFNKKFDDVATGHWAFNAITAMVAKHVITGVSETSFAPGQKVTRAEFAALLARKLNLKAKGQNQYSDVISKKWYSDDITAAVEAGIVKGRTKTKFGPEEVLTRQEMTVMIIKAYEIVSGNAVSNKEPSAFADEEKIAGWAVAAVSAASKLGFVQGQGNSLFDPLGTATRAEAAQIISKLE
ncbi:S-layer homology domain-containing protein [Cohnella silvisoli]|uniref:S-layer homology domain-containing protein n=1 Tax=Cohnella silvisoli TaxID=2873699 RepID=A0ABV1KR44_9BACL|nr:S-layer homology domain-containing protein [Cohnella silvisoli]MCD9022368.1 S-layer homology domain-containing protein [Cohnella silvisoli]